MHRTRPMPQRAAGSRDVRPRQLYPDLSRFLWAIKRCCWFRYASVLLCSDTRIAGSCHIRCGHDNTGNLTGEGSDHPDHAGAVESWSHRPIWHDTTDTNTHNRPCYHLAHNLARPAGVYNTSLDARSGKTHNRTNTLPSYDWIPTGFGIFRNNKTAHNFSGIPQIRSSPGCRFTLLSLAGYRPGNDADHLSFDRQDR